MSERTDHERAIVRGVQSITAVSHSIGQVFAQQHDLHETDFRALTHVMLAEQQGSPLSPGDLARILGVSSAGVTYVIDRLVEAGHLVRERAADDRRKVVLTYALPGQRLAEEFFRPLGMRHSAALEQFSDAELDAAQRVLTAAVASLEEHLAHLREDG